MDPIRDLLSTIVFFLAWLFPVLIIIATRRKVQDRKKKEVDSGKSVKSKETAGAGKPGRFPGNPSELVSRLMDIQGIKNNSNTYNAEYKTLEPEVKPAEVYRETPRTSKITPAVPEAAKRKRTKPLESLNRYPINKRAVVLAELIGKPKAFDSWT